MKSPKSVAPLGLLFLALPFAAMLLMMGINFNNITGYKEYRLEITGYDPRDLLRGHYLIFRYKWPEGTVNMYDDNSYPRTDQVCACMSGDVLSPAVRFDACRPDHPRQAICEGGVKVSGFAGGNGFQPADPLRQYYIPEEYALMLEKLLRSGKHKFEVGIVPRADGEAQLKMLYIDSMPLDEFLKQPIDNGIYE